MSALDVPAATARPFMLTVAEAAEVLGIGRTFAYELVHRFEESGGAEGIPVVRIGRCWRVPRPELLERIRDRRIDASAAFVRDELAPRRLPDVDAAADSDHATETGSPERSAGPARSGRRSRRQPPPDQPPLFPSV